MPDSQESLDLTFSQRSDSLIDDETLSLDDVAELSQNEREFRYRFASLADGVLLFDLLSQMAELSGFALHRLEDIVIRDLYWDTSYNDLKHQRGVLRERGEVPARALTFKPLWVIQKKKSKHAHKVVAKAPEKDLWHEETIEFPQTKVKEQWMAKVLVMSEGKIRTSQEMTQPHTERGKTLLIKQLSKAGLITETSDLAPKEQLIKLRMRLNALDTSSQPVAQITLDRIWRDYGDSNQIDQYWKVEIEQISESSDDQFDELLTSFCGQFSIPQV